MKKAFLLSSFAIAAALFAGCDKTPKPVENPIQIELSAVTADYASVTFTVATENAETIAYMCDAKGKTHTAQEIYTNGTASGTVNGTFTVTGLDDDTDYTLFVAASGKSLSAPSTADFKTPVNSGTPSTALSAGIRIEKAGTNDVSWEIVNGSGVNYSYTLIWPDVIIENGFLEAEKEGVSKTEYVSELIAQSAYLCKKVEGAGESQLFTYSVDFSSNLYPAADYSVYSLGVTLDDSGNEVLGDLTTVKFRTEGFDLIGNPAVAVTAENVSYLSITYKYTPNADCAH